MLISRRPMRAIGIMEVLTMVYGNPCRAAGEACCVLPRRGVGRGVTVRHTRDTASQTVSRYASTTPTRSQHSKFIIIHPRSTFITARSPSPRRGRCARAGTTGPHVHLVVRLHDVSIPTPIRKKIPGRPALLHLVHLLPLVRDCSCAQEKYLLPALVAMISHVALPRSCRPAGRARARGSTFHHPSYFPPPILRMYSS